MQLVNNWVWFIVKAEFITGQVVLWNSEHG